MQIGSPVLPLWLNYSLKSLCAVFTIKMNNCHYIANFFCMNTQRCQDIHLKTYGLRMGCAFNHAGAAENTDISVVTANHAVLSIAIITKQSLAIYICTCIWGTDLMNETHHFQLLGGMNFKSFMVISNLIKLPWTTNCKSVHLSKLELFCI